MSQAMLARLAAAMKRAVKRKADETDSDESVDLVTNRGHKLRKRARYVNEGKLAPPSGPAVYKRTITHAGYEREIISRRPPLYDDDGFEIDSDDDEESAQAAVAAAAEFYPYSDIRIEELLAPLTRPSDLADHPTLSRPFTSKPLTELTRQAREMAQKEKATLWKMKHLLTLMSGDHTWTPCEMLETPDDIHLFSDGRSRYREPLVDKLRSKSNNDPAINEPNLEQAASITAVSTLEDGPEILVSKAASDSLPSDMPAAEDDVAMIDVSKETNGEDVSTVLGNGATEDGTEAGQAQETENIAMANSGNSETETMPSLAEGALEGADQPTEGQQHVVTDGLSVAQMETEAEADGSTKTLEDNQATAVDDDEALPEGEAEEIPEPHRMRTRAQAQAASSNNTPKSHSIPRSSTPLSNTSFVHPFFLAPASAHPSGDMGLPAAEAEETRRLLQLYIQKQEEISRGSDKIYAGLMRAERLRKLVLKWCRAEGHLSEMSDGEDWVDAEEWGLVEGLKKGQEEEEEDGGAVAKKPRTRRQ